MKLNKPTGIALTFFSLLGISALATAATLPASHIGYSIPFYEQGVNNGEYLLFCGGPDARKSNIAGTDVTTSDDNFYSAWGLAFDSAYGTWICETDDHNYNQTGRVTLDVEPTELGAPAVQLNIAANGSLSGYEYAPLMIH